MDQPRLLTLIDATVPDAFERRGDRAPRVVEALLAICEDAQSDHAPPVIACAEADTALARGAFLVSGDGDGVVIGLDPIRSEAARRALLASFARSHAPGAVAVFVRLPDRPVTLETEGAPRVRFEQTDRRGVLVPNAQNWAALDAMTGET
ncbi:MAG: hypothetical protein AAGI03_13375 [Pseudomonadota bacterium]